MPLDLKKKIGVVLYFLKFEITNWCVNKGGLISESFSNLPKNLPNQCPDS